MEHDVWVEVDLGALQHNLRQVRGLVGDQVAIMAVVKSNGYGHGCVEPARAFIEAGADAVAVTRIEEGLQLRQSRIEAPILLLAPIQPANAEAAVASELSLTVTSLPLAQAISQAAGKVGKQAQAHVKVDTGMGRLGVPDGEAAGLIEVIAALPSITISGIYTHFATAAEPDLSVSRSQLRAFEAVLGELKARGIDCGLAHTANSAAIIRMPESRLDMVRPGTLLFGQYPSRNVPQGLDLKSGWKLKARICEIKHLPVGAHVGYGAEFRAARPTTTAVLPIGWSDGYTLVPEGPIYRQSVLQFAARKLRRRLWAELHGKQVPIIGRIAAQMTVLDITDIDGIQIGDEVTLPAMRVPVNGLVPRIYTAESC
jgi:alanine racemase